MSATRSRIGAFLGAAALITASLVAAPPAVAATLPGGLVTSFEIDGDRAGAVDWASSGYGAYTTSSGNASTGVLSKASGSDACGAPDPTTFTNGSKVDGGWPANPTPTTVQTKADLCGAESAYEIVNVNGANHVILYLNWTRVTGGTGDLTVYQHLQGAGAGRTGDLLIEFDYDPSSGTSVDGLRWNGSAWASSPSAEVFQAVVAPSQTFGEMAIDLTASGLIPSDTCTAFTTGQVLSRTGNSQNANIEDFLNPTPLTINTCASLEVEKVVEGAAPEGLGFEYQVTQRDGGDLGTPVGGTDTDGSESSITSTIQGGQTHTWTGLLTSPDYLVQELTDGLPAGVSLKTVVCSATNFFASGAPRVDVVLYENGSATGNVFPVFPDVLGAAPAHCTITNETTTLTLNKILADDYNGGATLADFTLSAEHDGTTVIDGVDPDADTAVGVTSLVGAGDYTLSETGRAGYAAGDWVCTGGELAGATVTVTPGANVECRITNTAVPAGLTLTKMVELHHGGVATADDFTLTAESQTHTVTGQGTVTDDTVDAGTYTLSEQGPAGYVSDDGWICTDDGTHEGVEVTAENQITLALGQHVSCEIVNRDVAPTLTLVKKVNNNHGGTLSPADVLLTATGPNDIVVEGYTTDDGGVTATVEAGDYVLAEEAVPGYDASDWVCEGNATALDGDTLSLGVGENVTCTITNSDQAAHLTLVKNVVNDDGGTATVADFPLTAAGPVEVTGVSDTDDVTSVAVDAGTYELSEEALVGGYSAGDWVCTGEGEQNGSSITLALGENATCTITNNDIAPTLTLNKVVHNDHGGTLEIGAVTLTAALTEEAPEPEPGIVQLSGTDPNASEEIGLGGTVPAGSYVLTESAHAGYTASAWVCTNGTDEFELEGGMLELGLDEDIVCTITNSDQAPVLTLNKVIVNDDGGTLTLDEVELTATDGEHTLTGTDPSADDEGVTGELPAGSYSLSESSVAGYAASEWTCTGNETPLDGAELTLALGEEVVCTITNDDIAPELTLNKIVVNDDGGTLAIDDVTLTAADENGTQLEGADSDESLIVGVTGDVPAGSYTLSESEHAGYTASDWVCTGRDLEFDLDDGALELGLGETITCTITNDDIAPELTLIKHVTNDHGGTATAADFPLRAVGADMSIGGLSGSDEVTNAPVKAGSYELFERELATYAPSSWTCDTEAFDGSIVTLAAGDRVVCEITNDDIAPTLTLRKEVLNDHGGTASETDFTLMADGPTPLSGVTGSDEVTGRTVTAGVYELSESGPAEYTGEGWTCTAGELDGSTLTLGLGENATCTILNDDNPALITLVKEVVNDDGGNAGASDFTLSATGDVTIEGKTRTAAVTDVELPQGAYALAETSLPGYVLDSLACWTNEDRETPVELTDGSVTLASGDTAYCVFVNNDLPVDLTLEKTSSVDRVAAETPFDFTLTVTNVGERDADLGEPITITDEMPEGLEVLVVPDGCTVDGSTVTCDIDPAQLTAGAHVDIVISVQFTAEAAAGPVTNVAIVDTPDDPKPENPTCEDDNVGCDEVELIDGAVDASKAVFEREGDAWVASDGHVDFGDTVRYRITVDASGEAPSRDIVITDQLQDGLVATGDWGCDVDCAVSYDEETATFTVTIDELAPGESAVFGFSARIPDAPALEPGESVTETFENVATVAAYRSPETPTNTVEVDAEDEEPPAATPTPTPEPTPTPTPEPTPKPSAEPSPTPSPSPEPTPEPTPSPEPTPTPVPHVTPSPAPSPAPKPDASPAPSPLSPTGGDMPWTVAWAGGGMIAAALWHMIRRRRSER